MSQISETMKKEITTLIESAKITYLSSVDDKGYPNVKAVLSLQQDGLFVHYFSTHLSSKKVAQVKANPKCSVYFCDEEQFKGLMLVGDAEVCTDKHHKSLLWREGFERYYPKGIDDENYCVIKFTANKGNYYHGQDNCDFNVEV